VEAAMRIERAVAQIERDLLVEPSDRPVREELAEGLFILGKRVEAQELVVVADTDVDAVVPQRLREGGLRAGTVELVGVLDAEIEPERRAQRRQPPRHIELAQLDVGAAGEPLAAHVPYRGRR